MTHPADTVKNAWISLVVVCALVIGAYAYMAQPGLWGSLNQNAGDANYNLLVQGFRAGQLSLKKDVPPARLLFLIPSGPSSMGLNEGVYFSPHELTIFVQFSPQDRGIAHFPAEAHPAVCRSFQGCKQSTFFCTSGSHRPSAVSPPSTST